MGRWTDQEVANLKLYYKKYGKNYAAIAWLFPGWTKQQIKDKMKDILVWKKQWIFSKDDDKKIINLISDKSLNMSIEQVWNHAFPKYPLKVLQKWVQMLL